MTAAKGKGKGAATHEVERQVQDAFDSEVAAISERVRAITLQALSAGELDNAAIKEVAAAVVRGAQQGAAGHAEHGAQALVEAMRGLDAALATAAEATQLAIREAAGRTEEFSRQGLKRAADDLAALESLFIEILGDAAKRGTGFATETLRNLAEHARASGTAVGGRTHEAVSQVTKAMADTARAQTAAGAQTLRQEGALLAGLAAGVLKGIAERLQPAPAEPKQRPAAKKGS